MAVDSYPSAGRDTGDGDGVISDVEYEALVSTFYPTGIIGTPSVDNYPVYTDGSGTRGIHFRAGAEGMVHGCRITHGATDTTINADANAGSNTRYDLAVWRLSRSGAATIVRPAVVLGGSSPAGPAPTQDPFDDPDGVWEYPLLIVPVDPGQTSIPGSVNTLARKLGYWIAPPTYLTLKGGGQPAPVKGQQIVEWETNRRLLGDGTKYLVNNSLSGAPANITSKSGWTVASGTVEKVDGTLYISGLRIDRAGAQVGVQTADVAVAALPAGYEPKSQGKLIGFGAGGTVMLYANTNGVLTLVYNDKALPTGTQMYFSDVAMRAAAA